MEAEEYIICSAVMLENGKIYYGHRHNHCLDAMNGELSWNMNRQEIHKVKKEQGFITNKNQFVSREQAWIIAEKANQIKQTSGSKGTLFSEDIY